MRTKVLTAGVVIGAIAMLGAHVTIGPTESRQGGRERYMVRVPTEGAVATVAVDLDISPHAPPSARMRSAPNSVTAAWGSSTPPRTRA